MRAITLTQIEEKQAEIGELIAIFKAQKPLKLHFPEVRIDLDHGERYAGIIIGKDGELSYHLILLPWEIESATWKGALDLAHSVAGGELPTRREQALLYANLKEQFEGAWYWSSEQHASYSDCAWSQNSLNGYQGGNGESSKLRARVVRRLKI